MKLRKGLAVLAIAMGVGMAGNVLGDSSRDILAEAASFTLNPVDEKAKTLLLDEGQNTLEVKYDEGTSAKTYGEVLTELADNKDIDYRAVLNYFATVNNDPFYGTPIGLWMEIRFFNWLEEKYGTLTSERALSLYNNWGSGTEKFAYKETVPQRYSLPAEYLEKQLDVPLKEDGRLNIMFKNSEPGLGLELNSIGVDGAVDGTFRTEKEAIHGLKGESIDMTHPAIVRRVGDSIKHTPDKKTVKFDDETLASQPAVVNYHLAKFAKIQYLFADGDQVAAPEKTVESYGAQKESVESPVIAGFTADRPSVELDFKDYNFGENDVQETVYYVADKTGGGGGDNNNNGNGDNNNGNETAVTPFNVYSKQKFYSYKNVDYKKNERVKGYAKKVRAHAPVFTAVAKATSKAGNPRYKLADGTYISAKNEYVANLYWQGDNKKLYVTHANGSNVYKSTAMNAKNKVKHLKQGTAVNVKRIVRKDHMTRYELANGTYVTGNKSRVSANKPTNAKQVQTKTKIKLYKDVNLTKAVKVYKKGQKINVKGWDHSHEKFDNITGKKRYKVAGGYITASRNLVRVVK